MFVDMGGKVMDNSVPRAQIATQRRIRRHERHAHRGGVQRECKSEIRVVHCFNRAGDALFDGAAKTVPHARGGVANPGRYHARDTPCPDHLVEEDVGNGPNECEVAASLADDLMARSEWDHLLKLRSHEHHRTGRHVLRDGLVHGNEFGGVRPHQDFVQKWLGSISRITASSVASGPGVVARSSATRSVHTVLLTSSSTLTPGCTEAR